VDTKEKIKTFKAELNLISDKKIKDFVKACLEEAPDYFFEDCPSSTSGKFHPIDEIASDGTILHTKRVFAVAYDLARGLDVENKRDIILAAALLHDLLKQGVKSNGHTVKNHPQLMADMITRIYEEKFKGKIPVETAQELYWTVCHHYGPWSDKRFKKPMTEYSMVELAVYVADYVSSKRFIHIDHRRRTD